MPRTGSTRELTARLTAGAHALLALVGLVGTWYFNLRYDPSSTGDTYLRAWFANPASSSAAVDVLVTASVACVFSVREGVRLRWRWWPLALVPLTFLVALAFTLPLFLALRELRLLGPGAREGRSRRPR